MRPNMSLHIHFSSTYLFTFQNTSWSGDDVVRWFSSMVSYFFSHWVAVLKLVGLIMRAQ